MIKFEGFFSVFLHSSQSDFNGFNQSFFTGEGFSGDKFKEIILNTGTEGSTIAIGIRLSLGG